MQVRNVARLAVALAASWLFAPGASAQVVISSLGYVEEGEVFFGGEDMPAELAAAMGQTAEPDKTKPTKRGERLKQLDYDRRASTILKAWSTPPKPEKAGASGADGDAKPAQGNGASEDAREVAEEQAAIIRSRLPAGSASVTVSSSGSITVSTPSAVAVSASGSSVTPATPLRPPAPPVGSSGAAATTPATAAPVASTPAVAATPATGTAAAAATEGAAPAADQPQDAAAAEEAQKKAAEAAAKEKAEDEAFEKSVTALQRDVTLGNWTAVKAFFDTLGDADHKVGYEHLLTSLRNGPRQRPQVPQQGQNYIEKNVFSPADVVGLAGARRGDLSKNALTMLGAILDQALDSGHQVDTFLASVRPMLDAENAPLNRRALAVLLVNAGLPLELDGLLPTLEEAREKNDREGLNLLSRYLIARHAKESKPTWLEQAWHCTQAVLAVGEVDEEAKAEALTRAVDIAPKVAPELGARWLEESFTSRPERGKEILATIGAATSTKLAAEPMNDERRLKLLELQSTATKALFASAPQLADEWKRELEVLADAWMREALFTYQNDDSTQLGPSMQRDPYGNFFYYDWGGNQRSHMPKALRTDKLLDTRPTDAWLSRIDATLQPRFQILFAQLLLKVGEDATAFPYIEGLARTLPKRAEELVSEFLRVWTKNHNPNEQNSRRGRYVYFFGFEERAEGIPLTRSKQDRNLRELGEWVTRLRTLGVEIDKDLLVAAFKTAHSSAEIYRLETVEQIFGSMETLDPQMLAGLVQDMRANLVETWRDPALQKDKSTRRKQQDIEAEVKRGYTLARATLDKALEKHAQDWRLWLARASIEHDENNFAATLKKDSGFSTKRNAAFETFAKAAELYVANAPELEPAKETTEVFEQWFYAALGACDLAKIQPKHVLAADQVQRIRERLFQLQGECGERHVAKFASQLFSRMSNANPGVKFRYVREGLAIVGEHKLAREARSVFDYYNDLVTEIQLVASIDGSSTVGAAEPFGLRVDIRHTREIERESGGFGKYLQNQNNMAFSYNYGRPTEDYRDKFEEAARETLGEHFEVLSVTFNDPKATSIADPEYGWRRTPYAYLLVKPRGPQVDKVPALRLDLDFLDTSGYAVLPVESSVLAIDASAPSGEARPYQRVALTQTLDERHAKEGKLLVEVKATALGLVPPLEQLVEFAPAGFTVSSTEDQGVSVVKFDEEVEGVVTERLWTLTLRAAEENTEFPSQLAFAKPRGETASSEHYRYIDADLASVGPTVELERRYGEPRSNWGPWVGGAVAALVALGFVAKRSRRKPQEQQQARFRVPEQASAFNVLGLLRQIHANNGLASDERVELEREIAALEQRFFAADGDAQADLKPIAERWTARAR